MGRFMDDAEPVMPTLKTMRAHVVCLLALFLCALPANAQTINPCDTAPVAPQAQSLETPQADAAQDSPQPVQTSAIAYITGGIGDEEREAMDAVKTNYNLHLTSAMATGSFVSGTRLKITGGKKNVVLDTAIGPIFYAKLAAGTYTLEGFFEGQTRNETVLVPAKGAALVRFGWK